VSAGPTADRDREIRLLLETIHRRFHHDFRGYALPSLRRRLERALAVLDCASVADLERRIVDDPGAFPVLLGTLTVRVTEMFRDPAYFLAVRRRVVPLLRTYPHPRLWIAGCSTGEEVYSFAILLREEGLLERSTIYATDIDPAALRQAQRGVYPVERLAAFSRNYVAAGGTGSLSDHYTAAYGAAALDRTLRRNVVFADHSLATDEVFAEVELVSCRNVLIYFSPGLQDRALGLFAEALVHRGVLGLGARESLRPSRRGGAFEDLDRENRLYLRRRAKPVLVLPPTTGPG
jgi:chemotaxis protein methyltransferase CheR